MAAAGTAAGAAKPATSGASPSAPAAAAAATAASSHVLADAVGDYWKQPPQIATAPFSLRGSGGVNSSSNNASKPPALVRASLASNGMWKRQGIGLSGKVEPQVDPSSKAEKLVFATKTRWFQVRTPVKRSLALA